MWSTYHNTNVVYLPQYKCALPTTIQMWSTYHNTNVEYLPQYKCGLPTTIKCGLPTTIQMWSTYHNTNVMYLPQYKCGVPTTIQMDARCNGIAELRYVNKLNFCKSSYVIQDLSCFLYCISVEPGTLRLLQMFMKLIIKLLHNIKSISKKIKTIIFQFLTSLPPLSRSNFFRK